MSIGIGIDLALRQRGNRTPPFSDDFNRADGAPGNGWVGAGAAISGNRLVITPAQGSELLTNGNFTAWTLDDPDNWSVFGESGADPEVSEVGSAETHGGTGTGAANFYSSATNFAPYLTQPIAGGELWYWCGVDKTASASGVMYIRDGVIVKTLGGGTNTLTRREWTSGEIMFKGGPAPIDLTLDDVSVKGLTDLLAYRTQASALAAAQANVWRGAADYQAGVVHRSDANNLVLAYIDGSSVKLVKRVAGTYTEVASVAITYSDGAALKLDRPANGRYVVSYNGAAVIDNPAITDAVFNAATDWGVFSTDAANQFDDYAWGAN